VGKEGDYRMTFPITAETQFMSVRDAARFTGLSEGAIRNMITRGQLEARRLGTRILLERARLEAQIRPLAEVAAK